ncbi:MAG: dephospho-CoA kinase, partial [Akkermansiaceae bacterium]
MLTLALTGGIASGKSTAVQLFQEFVPDIVVFDCDASVKALLDAPAVISEITQHFGNPIIDPENGKIIREKLRQEVFEKPEKRKLLESILHPLVREECLALKEKSSKQGVRCFLADVPLLFENGFDFGYDQAITIATSRATQVARLKARNGWNDDLIDSVLAAQLPVEEKISRADIVFWNDGQPDTLRAQIQRFCKIFPSLSMSETTQPTSNATAESEALEQTIAVVHEASAVEASELTSAATATAVEERVPYPVPENIVLNQFRLKPLAELQKIAADLPRKIQGGITKTQLIYEIICFYTMNGTNVTCEGVLEFGKEHFAMIRDPRRSFRPSQDD